MKEGFRRVEHYIHVFVTSSAETRFMEEQSVSSLISCFYTFVIAFNAKTTQSATKMLAEDAQSDKYRRP